jgi:hypothetical protein
MRIAASRLEYAATEASTERREQRTQVRVDQRVPATQTAKPRQLSVEELFNLDEDPRTRLIRLIVAALLGGRFPERQPVSFQRKAVEPVVRQQPQWSVTLTQTEAYEETGSLVVRARGTVTTAQGDEIRFDAELVLARSFRDESGLTTRAGNANLSDPLFLDTGGGQALLVHDTDGNGSVSGNAELFGAVTGDGFGELARLDADGNGWVDEADPAFGRLRLRLGDGEMRSLEEAGVGALDTTGIAGQFHFKSATNELTAVVRRTGVYLTEDGCAGALRQIDLVV